MGLVPCTRLLSTADAGATWYDVTPGRPKGEKLQPPLRETHPSGMETRRVEGANGVPRPEQDELHYGFDACKEWTAAQMQTLWSGSAFHDVGVYIGDFMSPIRSAGILPLPAVGPTLSASISQPPLGQGYMQTQDSGIVPILVRVPSPLRRLWSYEIAWRKRGNGPNAGRENGRCLLLLQPSRWGWAAASSTVKRQAI